MVVGGSRVQLTIRIVQEFEVCVCFSSEAGKFFGREEGGQLEKQIAEFMSWPTHKRRKTFSLFFL